MPSAQNTSCTLWNHLRLAEERVLIPVRVCVLLVYEAVAPEHGSAPAGVHHVHLVSTVRLRHPVGHVNVSVAVQTLIAPFPAKPLSGVSLHQSKQSKGQPGRQHQGNGKSG